jgi:hypothetical protein
MKSKTQSLVNGSVVRFNIKEASCVQEFDCKASVLARVEDKHASVFFATAVGEGILDYEYYDLTFADGTIIRAVSGYHLTPVEI